MVRQPDQILVNSEQCVVHTGPKIVREFSCPLDMDPLEKQKLSENFLAENFPNREWTINCAETVATFKQLLREKCGITHGKLNCVTFGASPCKLDDAKCLREYNFQDLMCIPFKIDDENDEYIVNCQSSVFSWH